MVNINGKMVEVEYIANDRGTATFWKNGICQKWRCIKLNNVWLPNYQIS